MLAAVSRIKKSPRLLNFSAESTSLTLSNTNSFHDFLATTSLFFVATNCLPKLSLIPLDGLLSLSIGLVGMIKGNLKLIDVRFKFFLDAKGFTLGTLLTLKRSSQRLHCTLVVLPGIIKLLLLLLDAAVNLLSNLSKLKLSPENLILFLFKSCFSLLKGRLELLLLNFQTATLFVQLMNGAATISQLIKEILDFIGKIFVLPLDNIKLLNNFIIASLEPVQFAVVVATFLLASLNLSCDVISLGLPFANDLVKVLATLLGDDCSSMGSLIIHGEFFQISLHTRPRFLSIGNLNIQ